MRGRLTKDTGMRGGLGAFWRRSRPPASPGPPSGDPREVAAARAPGPRAPRGRPRARALLASATRRGERAARAGGEDTVRPAERGDPPRPPASPPRPLKCRPPSAPSPSPHPLPRRGSAAFTRGLPRTTRPHSPGTAREALTAGGSERKARKKKKKRLPFPAVEPSPRRRPRTVSAMGQAFCRRCLFPLPQYHCPLLAEINSAAPRRYRRGASLLRSLPFSTLQPPRPAPASLDFIF